MCDDNACTYDDARVCDDPNCASNFAGKDSGNRNSYGPVRNDVAAYSWKKHCAGVAALIGIIVVAAICIVVATRTEETGGNPCLETRGGKLWGATHGVQPRTEEKGGN